jgi:hypothetical protein
MISPVRERGRFGRFSRRPVRDDKEIAGCQRISLAVQASLPAGVSRLPIQRRPSGKYTHPKTSAAAEESGISRRAVCAGGQRHIEIAGSLIMTNA